LLQRSPVVVGGRAWDKAGAKTRNADKTISIDRSTRAALRRWRERQSRERQLVGAAYHPGRHRRMAGIVPPVVRGLKRGHARRGADRPSVA
jgi:hypothetical protein